jgi:PPOX class probable F420-dependent enzyme
MRIMAPDEVESFLTHGTRTAKLATVRADGRPQVTPVWFVIDPETGDILFNTAESAVKGKNLLRDPRVTLLVDEEVPPYAYVQIEGIASLSTNLDEMLPWSTAIGSRYMGAENAKRFGQRNAVPGELLVRVHRVKTIAQAEIAS